MATEKIVVKIINGPGIFSLAIALFQPGHNVVEFKCRPFFFGDFEITDLQAILFSAKNVDSQPKMSEKRYWQLGGKIIKISTKFLPNSSPTFFSIYEILNNKEVLPFYFTCVYDIKSRKGQIVLTDDEAAE